MFDSGLAFVAQIGCGGSSQCGASAADGAFNGPLGVAVDASGNLWVADQMNNRVEIFDSGGNYLKQFGSAGSGDGQFSAPVAIAIGH